MKQVTQAQALEILKSKKSSFVSFLMETDPKLNKGGRAGVPKRELEVLKQTELVALVGTAVDYESLVQNRLIKESDAKGIEAPDFTAEERKWGSRVDGVEVQHKGGIYITLHCVANNHPKVKYLEVGSRREVSKDEIATWMPAKSNPDQGLDKPIIYRDYGLDSIKSFKLGGETYEIVI